MKWDEIPWQENEFGKPMLDAALEREDWELAAHVLVYQTLLMIEEFGPEGVEEMLSMLSVDSPAHRRRVGRRGRRGHHRR